MEPAFGWGGGTLGYFLLRVQFYWGQLYDFMKEWVILQPSKKNRGQALKVQNP